MRKTENLSQLHKEISAKLLDSIWLIEALITLNDGEAKQGTIIGILNKKIRSAFGDISKCRRIISTQD